METFSALLALCAGNPPVLGEFPTQRPVTQSFDVFFDQRLNKRLSKQSWYWWFETLSRPLWHHRNERPVINSYAESVSVSWRHHFNYTSAIINGEVVGDYNCKNVLLYEKVNKSVNGRRITLSTSNSVTFTYIVRLSICSNIMDYVLCRHCSFVFTKR